MEITQEELEQLADGLNPRFIRKEWVDFESVIVPLAKALLEDRYWKKHYADQKALELLYRESE